MIQVVNQALIILVPLAYLSTLFAYARRMTGDFEAPKPKRPITFLGLALLAHAVLLVSRYLIIDQLPWTNSFDVLSSLGFLMAFTYLLVEVATRVSLTGIDLLWLPFCLVTYAFAFGPIEPLANDKTDSSEFVLHTVPAVSALAALLVSGLYGLLYLRLSRAIKNKNFGNLFRRMPSLENLARMNLWAAAMGFLLVTVGIGVGATIYSDTIGRLDVFEPKIFMTLFVWTMLLLPLGGKLSGRWSDRATALVSVIMVGVIVLSILVATLPFISFER
ncbi:MAG: cytochrome c biogenesis protein CcsA [Planctomycetota bacterium]